MIALIAAAALAAAPPSPAEEAPSLVAVQAMYQQSCQVRAYGSYDDLCNALKKQLKLAEKAAKKADAEARVQAKTAKPATAAFAGAAPQQAFTNN